MEMHEKIKYILDAGYDIHIRDRTALGMGFLIEMPMRMVMKEGFNPCVPKKNGKAIYYGRYESVTGNTLHKTLYNAVKLVDRRKKEWMK